MSRFNQTDTSEIKILRSLVQAQQQNAEVLLVGKTVNDRMKLKTEALTFSANSSKCINDKLADASAYQQSQANFDPNAIARYRDKKVGECLNGGEFFTQANALCQRLDMYELPCTALKYPRSAIMWVRMSRIAQEIGDLAIKL